MLYAVNIMPASTSLTHYATNEYTSTLCNYYNATWSFSYAYHVLFFVLPVECQVWPVTLAMGYKLAIHSVAMVTLIDSKPQRNTRNTWLVILYRDSYMAIVFKCYYYTVSRFKAYVSNGGLVWPARPNFLLHDLSPKWEVGSLTNEELLHCQLVL